MVGLFQTDGTNSGTTSDKGRLPIELAERDADLLSELQRHIPVHTYLGTRTRTTNFKTSSTSRFLHIYAQDARAEFERFEVTVGKKSDSIRPPTEEFSRPDYLRGILDGDGSIGFTAKGWPFISLVTASPRLAQHFCAEIEAVCGVKRSAKPNKRDGVCNVMVANGPAVALASWCYPAGSLAIQRKLAIALEVAKWQAPSTRFGRVQRAWTAEEDAVVLSHSINEAANLLSRTEKSVNIRRWRLSRQQLRDE